VLINNIRCDWRGCHNLTNKIIKLSDLPDDVAGQIIPSYEVWVKICPDHLVEGVPVEELEFVVETPNHEWPELAPYSYHCIRCDYVWDSAYLYKKHKDFGKLPYTCTKCNTAYWFKRPRLKREATAGTAKPGKTWRDTEVYNKVRGPQ